MTVPACIENAAFEAHMAAVESLKASAKGEAVDLEKLTMSLAHAYGDAFALLAASGADNNTLAVMGRVYSDAVRDMATSIQTQDCMGRA